MQSGAWYLAHPNVNTMYIQCDAFGKAFLRTCPVNTIFTENMACEKQADHLLARGSHVSLNLDIGQRVPQFNAQCQQLMGTLNVVYFAHPQRADQFIQCDGVGNAFLKTCQAGTVFSSDFECVFPLSTPSQLSSSPYSTNQQLMAPMFEQQQPIVMMQESTGGNQVEFRSGLQHKQQLVGKIKTMDMKATVFKRSSDDDKKKKKDKKKESHMHEKPNKMMDKPHH